MTYYLLIGILCAVIVVVMTYFRQEARYRELAWLFVPVVIFLWPVLLIGLFKMIYDLFKRDSHEHDVN